MLIDWINTVVWVIKCLLQNTETVIGYIESVVLHSIDCYG